MNTKQIDYCIELAHTLNFGRAAENMFVSQPTLTYQIKFLEDEVGFEIFERSGKGATLTPAGTQFVTYLANMLEEMKRAIEQGQNFSAQYKDNITISLPVRQNPYGRRRISACSEGSPAPAHGLRTDRVFQQCGSRYYAYKCCCRKRHLPGSRLLK